VIDISEIATSSTGQKLSRCSSSISSGAAASATAVTVPLVARPIEYSCPVSRVDSGACSLIRATRSAAAVCSPMAGTAPTTRTASSEPSSPNVAGTSSRAATTLSR
jgi:hypothetical protein